MATTISAYVFCALTAVIVLFQVCLACGMPWGKLAMGGIMPGKFPPSMRVAAVVQAALLVVLALIVLTKAGLLFPEWKPVADKAIWATVAISTIATVLNLATPSKWERILWAPVATGMLVTSLVVANS